MKKRKKKRTSFGLIDRYYLETSVQIKRIIGHPKHKLLIENILKNSRKFSSYYIYKEFKETLLVPLINFYFILKEEETLSDAIKIISDTIYSTRDLKEIILFLSELLNERGINDKEKALSYIWNYTLQWYWLFSQNIDGFVNNISNFTNNKVDLIANEAGFQKFCAQLSCKGACGQEKFWKGHSSILNLILTSTNASYERSKDFKKHIEILKEISTDYKKSDMPTRCQKLGDVIIAIECPKGFRLLSLDKIFEIYNSILEKKYMIVPSLNGINKGENPKSN